LPAAAEIASVVHRGTLWEIPDAISALYTWIGENGYSAVGPYREIHHYWRENDLAAVPGGLDSVVIEMQLPVGKA
jgi:effector-binding domain-containing protein